MLAVASYPVAATKSAKSFTRVGQAASQVPGVKEISGIPEVLFTYGLREGGELSPFFWRLPVVSVWADPKRQLHLN